MSVITPSHLPGGRKKKKKKGLVFSRPCSSERSDIFVGVGQTLWLVSGLRLLKVLPFSCLLPLIVCLRSLADGIAFIKSRDNWSVPPSDDLVHNLSGMSSFTSSNSLTSSSPPIPKLPAITERFPQAPLGEMRHFFFLLGRTFVFEEWQRGRLN